MLDHMGFRVRNLGAARRFYEACTKALGLAVIDNSPESFLIGRSQTEPLPFNLGRYGTPLFLGKAAHNIRQPDSRGLCGEGSRHGRSVPSRRSGCRWDGQRQARSARTG